MATTYAFIPVGAKVMFEYNGNIREGVVEGVHRPTQNHFSAPTAYTVIYRRGQHTVRAVDVIEMN